MLSSMAACPQVTLDQLRIRKITNEQVCLVPPPRLVLCIFFSLCVFSLYTFVTQTSLWYTIPFLSHFRRFSLFTTKLRGVMPVCELRLMMIQDASGSPRYPQAVACLVSHWGNLRVHWFTGPNRPEMFFFTTGQIDLPMSCPYLAFLFS